MDKGLTLATILNDLPITRWDAGAGTDWRPKLAADLRRPDSPAAGLGQSKNVVMVRAMRAMGVDYAAEYLQRFGFPAQNIVHTESGAGLCLLHPMQLVRGYAVLANGGYWLTRTSSPKLKTTTAIRSKPNRKWCAAAATCR